MSSYLCCSSKEIAAYGYGNVIGELWGHHSSLLRAKTHIRIIRNEVIQQVTKDKNMQLMLTEWKTDLLRVTCLGIMDKMWTRKEGEREKAERLVCDGIERHKDYKSFGNNMRYHENIKLSRGVWVIALLTAMSVITSEQ